MTLLTTPTSRLRALMLKCPDRETQQHEAGLDQRHRLAAQLQLQVLDRLVGDIGEYLQGRRRDRESHQR